MKELSCLKIEPPREHDDRQWLTDAPRTFFGVCYGEVTLAGQYLMLGGGEGDKVLGTDKNWGKPIKYPNAGGAYA